MKVFITGHTKGIGLALFNSLTAEGHTVYGFSRSSGFDISVRESRVKIFEMSNDSDVFINNAYHPEGQLLLLEEFIGNWKGQDKLIINISSKLSYFPIGKLNVDEYILTKQKQNQIIQQNLFNGLPRILNIITGLVDTEMSAVYSANKISTTDLANFILYLVNLKDKIAVQEVVVDVPKLSWSEIKQVKNEY